MGFGDSVKVLREISHEFRNRGKLEKHSGGKNEYKHFMIVLALNHSNGFLISVLVISFIREDEKNLISTCKIFKPNFCSEWS